MSKTSVHKDPNVKRARENPSDDPTKTRALVRSRLEKRLDGLESFDAPKMIEEASKSLAKTLGGDQALLKIHLPELVRSYVGQVLYSMLSEPRPSLGEWGEALDGVRSEIFAGWFEHENGKYTRIGAMNVEQLRELADERERRIEGQIEAVGSIRRMADVQEEAIKEGIISDESNVAIAERKTVKLEIEISEDELHSIKKFAGRYSGAAFHDYTNHVLCIKGGGGFMLVEDSNEDEEMLEVIATLLNGVMKATGHEIDRG